MPSDTSSSISENSVSTSRTTPLPIAQRTPGCSIPLGIWCNTNDLSAMWTVCPALAPPWYRTTQSARSARTSTSLPLPSSPHCAPTTTIVRVLESNIQERWKPGTDPDRWAEKANAPRASGRWFNLRFRQVVSTLGGRRRRNFVDHARRIIRPNDASDRQYDGKRRSVTEVAGCKHVTAQGVDQFASNAEAEAGSTKFAGARLVDLTEILPDRLEIDFAYPD